MRLVNTQKSHFVRRQPNAAVPKAPLHNGHSDVWRNFDSLESFSCSWAIRFGARCSLYESCFASALT